MRSIFKRMATAVPAAGTETVKAESNEAQPNGQINFGLPEVEKAFGYGITDGRYGIPKADFEAYIAHSVGEDTAAAETTRLEQEHAALLEEVANALALEQDIARNDVYVAAAQAELSRIAAERDEHKAVQRSSEAGRESLKKGSLVMGIIFLIAAALFITGEVSVARSIVADGFEMDGLKALWFALGLAAISVLVKPAYDRLVEEPFWEGKPRVFRWVILGSTVIAFATIFALAVFRNDAFITGKEVQALTDLDQILALLRELGERPSGRFGLIGAAITFALGGAVCMSIGLAHMRDWNDRRLLTRRISAADTACEKQAEILHDRKAELAAMKADLHRRDLEDLIQRTKRLSGELTEQRRRTHDERRERLISLYREGHELGSKAPAQVRFQNVIQYDGGDEAIYVGAGTMADGEKPRPRKQRPYVALRRMIRDQALSPTARVN